MAGIGESALSRMLEDEYRRGRAEAAERLHNAIADVIAEQAPGVETVLYVLEMLRLSILQPRRAATMPEPSREAIPQPVGWRSQKVKGE